MSAMYLISFTCKVLHEVIFHKNWCHLYITSPFDVDILPQAPKRSKDVYFAQWELPWQICLLHVCLNVGYSQRE